MKRLKTKIDLERERKFLEQYDYYEEEEIYARAEKYAKSIGSLLLSFSNLECSLDRGLVNLINDNWDEDGFRIIKYLEFREKVNLFTEMDMRMVSFITNAKTRQKRRNELRTITRKLEELSEFRNKIAHANWMTLDKKGFVRTTVKEDRGGEGVFFEHIKITPEIVRKFIRQMDAMNSRLDIFEERLSRDIQK